jgi:FMN-dependent dehydrogenase
MGNAAGEQASTQPQRITQPPEQQSAAMKFTNLIELEAVAKLKLTRNAYNYYASGAGGGETLQQNRDAFQQLRLLPRIMVDVSAVDTSISFFGMYSILRAVDDARCIASVPALMPTVRKPCWRVSLHT